MRPEIEPQASEGDAFGVVEKSIAGVFAFGKRFVSTVAGAAVRPSRLVAALGSDPEKSDLTGPYTFICIATFVTIRLLRWSIVLGLIATAAFGRSCAYQTPQDVPPPSLEAVFALPTISDLLFFGVPMVAVALALAFIARMTLTRSAPGLQSYFSKAACYAVGLQYLLCVPACLLAFVFVADEVSHDFIPGVRLSESLNRFVENSRMQGVILGVLWAWPAFCFFRLCDAGLVHRNRRLTGNASFHAAAAAVAAVLSAATLLAGFGIAYPVATIEYRQRYEAKPMINVFEMRQTKLGVSVAYALAISNNTTDTLVLLPDHVSVLERNGMRYHARIIDEEGHDRMLVTLAPYARAAIMLSIQQVEREASGAEDLPQRVVTFKEITRTGDVRSVSSLVFSDPDAARSSSAGTTGKSSPTLRPGNEGPGRGD